eukprot:scaffold34616_cov275-Amphora_coffeaeformis.AAC.1
MNHGAVQWIFEGYAEEVKELLVDCISDAKEEQHHLLSRRPAPTSAATTTTTSAVFSQPSTKSECTVEMVPLVGALGPEDEWQGYKTSFFRFYRKACLIHFKWGDDNDDEVYVTAISILMAVASYNLALIYHHQGIVEYDAYALSRARVFYFVSLNALKDINDTNVKSDQGTEDQVTVLEIAIYNNLGQLNSYVNDSQAVVQCWQDLQKKLMRIRRIEPEMAEFILYSLGLSPNFSSVSHGAPVA